MGRSLHLGIVFQKLVQDMQLSCRSYHRCRYGYRTSVWFCDYPFLYLTGHGNIKFTEREVENLRTWMLRGGFLYVDDDYGMDESFRREIKRIFPERELIELDPSFPLFNCFFDFSNGLPKIHLHDGKPPQAFGIFDDNGLLMCLYTYETNISDGWADPETHNDPPEVREKALKFGVNILYYVMHKQ